MPQWAVLLERQAHLLCPLLSRSAADGGARAGHTSPYRGRSILHRGGRSQRAQTHRIGRLPFGAAHGSAGMRSCNFIWRRRCVADPMTSHLSACFVAPPVLILPRHCPPARTNALVTRYAAARPCQAKDALRPGSTPVVRGPGGSGSWLMTRTLGLISVE